MKVIAPMSSNPTTQELVIMHLLKSRPQGGWSVPDLLNELSKGRVKPMSYSCLAVHMHNMRGKGIPVMRQVMYSLG